MLLCKEDLPNLDRITKNLVFRGSINLYKKKTNFEAVYFLQFNEQQSFLLNYNGVGISEISGNINKDEIEEQVFFKDSFENPTSIKLDKFKI